MEFRTIPIEDLPDVLEIFHHDNLKYADGTYPEEKWITEFIKHGYAYGTYEDGLIKAALVAEPMLSKGIYLWLIATRPIDFNKGYGQFLLTNFKEEMKSRNKAWIYLTSWDKTENFYLRNGAETGNLNVKEFCISLD